MDATIKKQDMPPPGGYTSINYKRVPPKSYFRYGYSIFATYLVCTAVGLVGYYFSKKKARYEEIEHRSARHAFIPLLMAERDRAYLKQLRRNRDEEADLMKNVPGWKVGTLFGEPIFKTLPPDTLVDVTIAEYNAHVKPKDYRDSNYIHLAS